MLAAVVDHLWQSTLIALGAAGLAIALRRQAASVRYWIWFGASLKFLIPFALLSTLGAELSWRVAEPEATDAGAPWTRIAERLVQPIGAVRDTRADLESALERTGATATPTGSAIENRDAPRTNSDSAESSSLAASLRASLPTIAALIWMIVALTLAAVWAGRYYWLCTLARKAVPVSIDLLPARGLDIRLTDSMIEPGLFGIGRPILLLPAGILERLSREELAAVIGHERCHLQRRDNLTALPPMLVAAIFWFFPIVWWISRRLVEERERACDEAVLAAGVDGATYARGILEVCSVYLRSPLTCAAGVGGGRLKRRIREILARRKPPSLGSFRRGALLSLPLVLLALPFGVGLMTPAQAQEQEQEQTQQGINPFALSRYQLPVMVFTSPLWVETGRQTRLFHGYQNETAPGSWPGARPDIEPRFGIRLLGCPAIRTFAIDAADPDVEAPPRFSNLADLVAYAYGLEPAQIVLPDAAAGTKLWSIIGWGAVEIRHSPCRDYVRRVLQEDNALAARYDAATDRLVVERIELPEPLPSIRVPNLTAYGLTPVDVDPSVLDTYVGLYARPFADSRYFAPVFEIRRQGSALVVIWNEDEFVVQPGSESEFGTLDGYRPDLNEILFQRPQPPPSISLTFLSTDEVRITSGAEDNKPAYPWDFARRVDATTAAAIRDDIQSRFERQQSAPAAETLVREIVALLDVEEAAADTSAAVAARAIRSYVQLNDPGRIQLRGALRSIALREVLPSGREIHDVVFEGLALQLEVGAAGPIGVEALEWDITCRRRNAYEVQIAGPCAAPAAPR